MSQDSLQTVVDKAEEHAIRLEEDIKLARTRDEHLRVTARANEARKIADDIQRIGSMEL
jgi:hypothetical protein